MFNVRLSLLSRYMHHGKYRGTTFSRLLPPNISIGKFKKTNLGYPSTMAAGSDLTENIIFDRSGAWGTDHIATHKVQ